MFPCDLGGEANSVVLGSGPGQFNTSSGPFSQGEGFHAVSHYLTDGVNPSSLTISFADSVLGVGLFTIDYFNPKGTNPLTMEAFTGPQGTGTSLGVVTSASF